MQMRMKLRISTSVTLTVTLMTTLTLPSEMVCLHDKVQGLTPMVKTYASYDDDHFSLGNDRKKRSDFYKPIRIKLFWDSFHMQIPAEEKSKLNTTVTKVIEFIQSFLYVIPVSKTLVFKRTGCWKTWSDGPNTGKCALIKRYYRAELCAGITKIPDSHLGGLFVWSKNDTDKPARRFYEAGDGVSGADFVLYVSSLSSATCYTKSRNTIIAYAGYCQLDQNDRPVAGYINICPNSLLLGTLSQDRAYKTILHELFHALGFSKKLFDKLRDCSSQDETVCPQRTTQPVQSVQDVHRLVTPQVVMQAQNHFGCHGEEKYGGPLDFKNGKLTSHWNERFMFGSIMTPKIGMPHLTLVDPMTLAYFEDTGWYKVDYSKADTYFWGKGEGCSFGIEETCNKPSSYFCHGNYTGCHYLHKDKGRCKPVDTSTCHIVQPSQEDECNPLVGSNNADEQHLCFLSNVTNIASESIRLEGRCHLYRCGVNKTLEVKVMESDWVVCPFGEYITIPDYFGVVACPDHADIVCPDIEVLVTTPSVDETTTNSYTSTNPGGKEVNTNTVTTQSQMSGCGIATNTPKKYLVTSIFLFIYILIYDIHVSF